MIKNKIIVGLIIVIFAILCVFELKMIKDLKKSNKTLQTQIIAINSQNEKNRQDLANRNEELNNNQVKINDLQKKIKIKFKKDNCVNIIVDTDFLNILRDKNSK